MGYGALNGNPNFSSVYGNSNRLNLNYVNVNGLSATNFVSWTNSQFFYERRRPHVARVFPRTPFNLQIDVQREPGPRFICQLNYIPVWPTNYYTPAVHRVLQLAANIYDSGNTNRYYDQLTPAGPFFPSVFKPYFCAE